MSNKRMGWLERIDWLKKKYNAESDKRERLVNKIAKIEVKMNKYRDNIKTLQYNCGIKPQWPE